jgi:hypothetical protein
MKPVLTTMPCPHADTIYLLNNPRKSTVALGSLPTPPPNIHFERVGVSQQSQLHAILNLRMMSGTAQIQDLPDIVETWVKKTAMPLELLANILPRMPGELFVTYIKYYATFLANMHSFLGRIIRETLQHRRKQQDALTPACIQGIVSDLGYYWGWAWKAFAADCNAYQNEELAIVLVQDDCDPIIDQGNPALYPGAFLQAKSFQVDLELIPTGDSAMWAVYLERWESDIFSKSRDVLAGKMNELIAEKALNVIRGRSQRKVLMKRTKNIVNGFPNLEFQMVSIFADGMAFEWMQFVRAFAADMRAMFHDEE